MANYNNTDKVVHELSILNNSMVAVGFLAGTTDFRLLTIVRANEFGARIVPKHGKFLTIPSKECPKGSDGLPMRPREIDGLFRPKDKNVLCVSEGGKLVVYFYLVKKVVIPARPFIRTAFQKNKNKYAEIVHRGISNILHGTGTAVQLLNQLGEIASTDIKLSSIKWSKPPNAPLTVANKGANNPLVDTGMLQKHITYQVFLAGKRA